jgi:2-polyprenyl-6-methoxyphenol hydroxylase-like FAD-dependent oxidoreductase
MTPIDVPVGIVGAGPVGLVTAARLASFGIPSVLFEADPHLRKQGSKACLIQGDVLEVLDTFGCAEQIAREGVTWHVARTYVRNREIRTTVHPQRIGYGPFVNISQYRIEQVLLAKVEADPQCTVLWSHRIVDVTQDDEGVVVQAQTPDGDREYRFRYLVACDGVRSELRGILGVEWTGYSHKDRFLITDIRAELPLAKERHFHYDPSFNPGRQLVIHPQPANVWRIDWQLPPDADIEAERRSGALDRRVRAVIGDTPYEIDWLSTYRFHQRVVNQFRVGRAFFAGDAAHALPPYGSRGMNSGIQDADNLAWKLALVLDRRATEDLLDTYHDERYAAARENLAITEATIRFMVPPSLPRRLIRAALLRLSHPFKSVRRHVNSGRMAEPFVYRDSPIVDPPNGHPLVGAFAPDGWVDTAGRRERIRTLFGEAFVGLLFATDPQSARDFAVQALAGKPQVPARLVLVLPAGIAVPTDDLPQPVVVVNHADVRLRAEYHADRPCWLLVRPDGHIAAAVHGTDGGQFAQVIGRCARAVAESAGTATRPHAPVSPRAQEPGAPADTSVSGRKER